MGTILLPAMIERGYPRSLRAGRDRRVGHDRHRHPAGLALILYGIVAEQSVPRLFLAGILPGPAAGGGVLRSGSGTTRGGGISRSSRRGRWRSDCG